MSALSREDASPLYEQLMQRISSAIRSGEYGVGCRLPNETELCQTFQVSRITLRRAVSELVKQGVLEKRQGKGTFVCSAANAPARQAVSSFHETCRRRGLKASTRLIHARQLLADAWDQEALHLAQGQRILEILRVRLADCVPVMVENNHFSVAYAYLDQCDLESSLYHLLKEFGVEVGQAVHEISIRRAQGDIAKWLGVPLDTPLLYLEELIYDQKGRPLHTSKQWIRSDRFPFRI